jgi:hypothetical protein
VQAIDADDTQGTASASAALLERLALLIQNVASAVTTLNSLSSSVALTAIQQAELSAYAGAFADRLLQRLLVEYLSNRVRYGAATLVALGVIEIVDAPSGGPGSLNEAYTRKGFSFDRLVRLLTDPKGMLQDTFGWGQVGFDGVNLLSAWQSLLETMFDIPAQLLRPAGGPAVLEAFGFTVSVDDTLSPQGLDLSLRFPAAVDRNDTVDAGDWHIVLSGKANFDTDLTAKIRPFFDLEVDLPSGSADLSYAATFERASTAAPFLILGAAAGTRLECQSLSAAVGLTAYFDTANNRLTLDPQFKARLQGGKLVVSGQGADGFIGTLLGGIDLESDFDVGLTWSPSAGVAFVGSAGLEIKIPVHISIGPLDIVGIYLRGELKDDGTVPIELSGAFDANLGPLVASVDRLGLVAVGSFPSGGGNLGPTNLALNFKPPNGIGLSVDAGAVQGGGYLYIDTARGEYAGALELVVADWLQLTAIGLITTKMPDGSTGFSLLVIITADFGTGIELGFGFTLIGVGGLLGLNRTMLLQPLMDGVRTGAINGILFPTDVVANAPKIISDLKAIFPPKNDTFLIGPMAKIGWGTPTLITGSLGVIIEIPPADIAILGIIQLALPEEDDIILLLQVNFAGALEFDKKRLYFFASLYDSRILFITIQGEMGLLVRYGSDANFVLSVGGFHPQFNPPPLPFPSPNRVQLDIINESYARVRADGYFAVTSNTAQFGAHSEYFFGFSAVSVTGHSGFDALFQFSPFYFIVEGSTAFSANVFGVGVYSLDIDLTLSGPTPWHAHGNASISFLFFSIGIGIDITWGDSRDTSLPPIAVMPILVAEFGKSANWRAQLPAGSNLLVSLRQLDPADTTLVLHPVGTLRVSQRAVPIDLTLDKDGEQTPSDANRFHLDVSPGGLARTQDLSEPFAPAQFRNFSDADKLSQAAFTPQHSGVELAASGSIYATGTAITRNVRYELTVIDTQYRRYLKRFFVYINSLFLHFLGGASVARNTFSATTLNQMQPWGQKIAVSGESFAVANLSDNRAFSANSVGFSSTVSAQDFLNSTLAAQPSLTGTLHVLGQHELTP